MFVFLEVYHPARNLKEPIWLTNFVGDSNAQLQEARPPHLIQQTATASDSEGQRKPAYLSTFRHQQTMILLPKIKARLTATAQRVRVCLDFQSLLAIQYAKKALTSAGATEAPTSLVIRLALMHYADHLSDPSTHLDAAAVIAFSASKVERMPQQAQQDALQRLNESQEGQALPHFSDVLSGPGYAAAVAAIRLKNAQDLHTI